MFFFLLHSRIAWAQPDIRPEDRLQEGLASFHPALLRRRPEHMRSEEIVVDIAHVVAFCDELLASQ